MGSRNSFVRKIVYLVLIAALLMPLYWLSKPATSAAKGEQGSPGGVLAQLRTDHHLSQSQLGQIDPGSVTVKLAMLGLRGVAANILWEKANDFKMKKDWTNFGATLNQITKVQPNFINVWSNQAWNLSYNISVEFDDFVQRYRWIIKGIEFLMDGMRYNQHQPRLQWDTGWFISHKIGKADEAKQFRKLFKEDDDFNGSRPMAERDNWLVGKKWFEEAVAMVERGDSMLGKGPLLFRSDGPMCQMSYADNLEKDGTFGEVAKNAWAAAGREWKRYGTEEIPTSWKNEETQAPIVIRLGEQEMHEEAARKLVKQMDAMEPGLREKLKAEKRAALSKVQREALETPPEKRTARQVELAAQAEADIDVTHREVARRLSDKTRKAEALKLAKQAAEHEQLAGYINRYRDIVNYTYWRQRAKIEQSDDLLAARQAVHRGDQAYAEGDLVNAKKYYHRGFEGWRKVLDRYPSMVTDEAANEALTDSIKQYRRVLGQLDEPLPDKFILQDVVDAHMRSQGEEPKKKQEELPDAAK
ncbi:MAG: hypothetical protein LLF97_11145 [Planctomycetaceae bacterium]|nr:hypothetical protein [Planctomycetaceae bacterium]